MDKDTLKKLLADYLEVHVSVWETSDSDGRTDHRVTVEVLFDGETVAEQEDSC